jgi:putative tricarboxylic transport membrane protein
MKEARIKKLEDRITGAAFLIFSLLIMGESWRLKLNDIYDPGPGFVPFFLGMALAGLSIFSLIFPAAPKQVVAFWHDWEKGKSVCFIFAGLVVYLILFRILGFYIDTFLLMVFLVKLSGGAGYRQPLLVALLTVGITYILFHKLLFIPFPQGILGI